MQSFTKIIMSFTDSVVYLLQNSRWILIVFMTVLVMISIKFKSRSKCAENPFSQLHIKPRRPLVTDHASRNRVLKQRFRPDRVPDNLDAIVIGSGIGGLSVAVLLSRAGKTVLVLEQHDQAGGCCHTFLDKGFEFDTGIHYVGKMFEGSETRILMDQLTEGQLDWVPTDEEYDLVVIGDPRNCKRYPLVAGRVKSVQNLKKMFPNDIGAVDMFMRILNENRGTMRGLIMPKVLPRWLVGILIKTGLIHSLFPKFFKYARLSLKETLDGITDNQTLKAVLSYAYGDLGAAPSDMSMIIYSALMNHYIPGAFYPAGGPSEIALHMIPIIQSHGGQVLVDATVSQVLVDRAGKACGVKVSRRNGEDISIFACTVISDAGAYNTYVKLLPQQIAVKTALYQMLKDVGPSHACITVFAGLDGRSEELGLTSGNTWAFSNTDLDGSLKKFFHLTEAEAASTNPPMMFISFPSAKDPTWNERYPGKSVCILVVVAPQHWFLPWKERRVKHRGDDYAALKMQFSHELWGQCELMFPNLQGKLLYMEVSTPISNRHYLGCASGEIYGLNHTKARLEPRTIMELRPDTEIPGLFLTGQDVFTAGFVGALYGGLLCSSVVLHRNLMLDLKRLSQNMRRS